MSQTQGQKANAAGVAAQRPLPAWRLTLMGLGLGIGLAAQPVVRAQDGAASRPAAATATAPAGPASVPTVAQPPKPAVQNSYLDGPLLYQLLLAEFAHNANQPADAIELMVEAARRNKDDQLFRRAIEMAAEAGATDKALSITKAWHQSIPKSTEALRTEVQLLLLLDRMPESAEPLRQLLSLSSPAERSALIASLPRAAQRAQSKGSAAEQFRVLLQP